MKTSYRKSYKKTSKRSLGDILKFVLVIALVVASIGAMTSIFAADDESGAVKQRSSTVDTTPDISFPEESDEGSEDGEYLDVVLHPDVLEGGDYADTLDVQKLSGGGVKINGYTISSGENVRPFAFIVDMSDIYEQYGECYYVLSYEVVSSGNDHDYILSLGGGEQLTGEPQVFRLRTDTVNIALLIEKINDTDVGVEDLVIRFKGMYVSQEYIETIDLD